MNTLSTEQGRLLVGLTGGIGSGKSTVAAELRRAGAQVIDSDAIAHQVVKPGQPAFEQIIKIWPDVETESGINRKRLAQYIFNDPEQKRELEGIVHPAIGEEVMQQLRQPKGHYTVLDSPLLLEKGGDKDVDKVLVVDVPPELQRQRACVRALANSLQSRDEILRDVDARIASQISRQERLARADYVIENNDNMIALQIATRALHVGCLLPLALIRQKST